MDLPHEQVEKGGHEQRRGTEQVGEAPATRVGHDASRHFEHDLADREEGVGGEGLRVVQACVEQEDRVDAPDEGRRERRQERQSEVRPLDSLGRITHAPGWCGRSAVTRSSTDTE